MALANTRPCVPPASPGRRRTSTAAPSCATGRRPTGIFKDNAMADRRWCQTHARAADRALDAAMKYVAERGVTSVGHMGTLGRPGGLRRAQTRDGSPPASTPLSPLATWDRLRDARRRTSAPTAAATSGCTWAASRASWTDPWARTPRRFEEPFTDAPNDSGFFVTTPEDLHAWTTRTRRGCRSIVHAIGDRANRTDPRHLRESQKENGPRDRRFRIEHAQHIRAVRHPALRRAGRDRHHAALPRDRRRPLGRK